MSCRDVGLRLELCLSVVVVTIEDSTSSLYYHTSLPKHLAVCANVCAHPLLPVSPYSMPHYARYCGDCLTSFCLFCMVIFLQMGGTFVFGPDGRVLYAFQVGEGRKPVGCLPSRTCSTNMHTQRNYSCRALVPMQLHVVFLNEHCTRHIAPRHSRAGQDPGVGAHAPDADVLAACCSDRKTTVPA
jgi:hypothetical protein